MTLVFLKLLAIFAVVGVGYAAGRTRILGGREAARAVAALAFFVFAPALLFRTTARIDIATLPWATLAGFFIPVVGVMVAVYAWEVRSKRNVPAASPGVRSITATFGNTAQLGIPLAAGLFGEAGLSVHVTIVALHAITLLTVCTVLTELDVARERARASGTPGRLGATLLRTVRQTFIHPVVLPVMLGLAFNLAGLRLPEAIDGILAMLAQGVVPVALTAIGMSLAHYGLRGVARSVVALSVAKLVVQPAAVLVVAHWVFGITGLPLTVVVLCAALPAGTNALMFAQHYETREQETTATIVLSTLLFVGTAPMWLSLLAWMSHIGV